MIFEETKKLGQVEILKGCVNLLSFLPIYYSDNHEMELIRNIKISQNYKLIHMLMSGSHQGHSAGSHQVANRQTPNVRQFPGSLEASCDIHQTMDYRRPMKLFSLKSQNMGMCRQIGQLNLGVFSTKLSALKKVCKPFYLSTSKHYLGLGFEFGPQNLPS